MSWAFCAYSGRVEASLTAEMATPPARMSTSRYAATIAEQGRRPARPALASGPPRDGADRDGQHQGQHDRRHDPLGALDPGADHHGSRSAQQDHEGAGQRRPGSGGHAAWESTAMPVPFCRSEPLRTLGTSADHPPPPSWVRRARDRGRMLSRLGSPTGGKLSASRMGGLVGEYAIRVSGRLSDALVSAFPTHAPPAAARADAAVGRPAGPGCAARGPGPPGRARGGDPRGQPAAGPGESQQAEHPA